MSTTGFVSPTRKSGAEEWRKVQMNIPSFFCWSRRRFYYIHQTPTGHIKKKSFSPMKKSLEHMNTSKILQPYQEKWDLQHQDFN
eukprot:2326526-Amphidinium_carterae.1